MANDSPVAERDQILAAAKTLLANVEPPLLRLGLAVNDDAELVCAECGGGFRADKEFVLSHASRCPAGHQPFAYKDVIEEQHGWLYAVWMAFLAEEETGDLQFVLRNLSTWMAEREASNG